MAEEERDEVKVLKNREVRQSSDLIRTVLPELVPQSTERLVQDLEEVVRMALDVEKQPIKQGVSFVNIMKDLAVIQRAIEVLAADQEDLNRVLNRIRERFGPFPENKEEKRNTKRLVEKLKDLQSICEGARERLHEELAKSPKSEEEVREILKEAEASPKRKTTRRKRKFRSMGGDKEWIKT